MIFRRRGVCALVVATEGMNRRLRWLLLGIFLLGFSINSAGQELSLTGTVRDADGVVPDATVVLSRGDNQLSTVMTDGNGGYSFANLAVGSYELSVSRQGFDPATRTVSLGPNAPPVDIVLAVGRVSTSVTVIASEGRATATRLPVPDIDVPAQVSTVPEELMQQQGTNTVMGALGNASGVEAYRWYGVYEQYTIRGFADDDRDSFNAVLTDGMRFFGNRYSTQTNNVESIQVLKGPSSILYGRGAVGGSINILRKKPQSTPAYDFTYQGGRFNSHQVSGGATGRIDSQSNFLYRIDAGYDHTDGWRHAGSDRVNITPSLTWNISEGARLTVMEVYNHDHFDGDGGVPYNIVNLPDYRPDLLFSLPQDRVLVKDSQTEALFNVNLSSNWELRDNFKVQRTSDQYFVTEGVYGDPDNDLVFREPLDFHHTRTPVYNRVETVGSVNGFGKHNLLLGYEYSRDSYRTDVTAGDDPDCTCGYWWITIAPMEIATMQETNPTLDITTIARQTFVNDQVHGVYGQDQIDILPQLKLNVGVRYDHYTRKVERQYLLDPLDQFQDGRFELTNNAVDQNAVTYRAGLVYVPRYDHQIYFGTSSAFTPPGSIAPDGSQLDPSTSRNYEVGYRWQGFSGRVNTSVAYYYTLRNNVGISPNPITVLQVGQQKSQGIDLDINTDLGRRTHLLINYGYNHSRFADADDLGLTGFQPFFAPHHLANAWLRKDWAFGFNASFGVRYVGPQFADQDNTITLGGYTIFSGAVGFRRDRWEWSLNAENLFNRERYFLPGHFGSNVFPGQPINVFTAIRLHFQ